MNWVLKIKKADNGYILTGKFGDAQLVDDVIVEQKDTEDGELEAVKQMLWLVKEYFGVYYSKHSEKNIVVEIKNIGEKG